MSACAYLLQEVRDALALREAEAQALKEGQHLPDRAMEQYVTCTNMAEASLSGFILAMSWHHTPGAVDLGQSLFQYLCKAHSVM